MKRRIDAELARLSPLRLWALQDLILFESVTSTNEIGKELVEKMMAEDTELLPTAIAARCQTSGRGRLGRKWMSPAGSSLSVSVVLPWPEGPHRVRVPVEMAVKMARELRRDYGLPVKVKWPNDLVVERRKLGGILVEARAGADGEGYVIVGIGLNVSLTREDLDGAGLPEATSLLVSGVPEARLASDEPLLALLRALDRSVFEPIADLSLAFEEVTIHARGDRLEVLEGDRRIEGAYLGVSEDGFLRLATGGGGLETLVSGDVARF